MVEELNSYTQEDLADLDALMHELSATSSCNEALLKAALADANVHVYVGTLQPTGCTKASALCGLIPIATNGVMCNLHIDN